MKRCILAARWVLVVGLLLAFGLTAAGDENRSDCVVTFAITAGVVIGLSLLAPRQKPAVSLLAFGMGITLSVSLFRVAPDLMFRADPKFLRLSVEWKQSACGVIGSVIGLLVARKTENKCLR